MSAVEQATGKWAGYSEYGESGDDWFGRLPNHWDLASLRWLVSGERPITYGIVQCGPDVPNGVPYVRPVDMGDECGAELDNLQRTAPDIAARYSRSTLRPGDLVVSIGPSFGKAMIVPDELDGANLTQGTARVAAGSEVDRHFLFWVLRSTEVHQWWDAGCAGATFRALTLELLSATPVPLPPLAEQRAIAEFLDRETGRIDALIERKRRLIELLEEKRTALITRAVTKGLDPDVPLKPSGVEWLGDIPEHWEVWKTAHAFRKVSSGTTPPSQSREYYDGDICWVNTSELRDARIQDTGKKITQEALREFSALKLYAPGTVLVALYGATIGKVGLLATEATVNQACCALLDSDVILPEFAFHVFVSARRHLLGKAYGGGQPNISQETIRSLKLPVPPVSEQRVILEQINHSAELIDGLVEQVEQAITRLQEYRTALISAAVTGKIDVRDM